MKNKIPAYKFSPCATPTPPEILGGKSPMEFLKSKFVRGCIFGLDELHRNGHYKLSGWSFDFTEYLKRFVIHQYTSWFTRYAPNKTMLRNSTFGSINEIIEAP